MSTKPQLVSLAPEELAGVSGGMQGAGAMQMIGSLLGGLRNRGGAEGDPSAAQAQGEAPAQGAQSGGFPVDQIAAFAANPSLQSGMQLVTSLMARRQQAQ